MGARLKFWRRSRIPKKGSRDEAVVRGFAAPDSSAVKSHSTILQRLRRQLSLDYYTVPPATQASLVIEFIFICTRHLVRNTIAMYCGKTFTPPLICTRNFDVIVDSRSQRNTFFTPLNPRERPATNFSSEFINQI